ncbi:Retrovirus-related Pol polyprotein, partial [Mucuna pruriens]
MKQTFLEKFFPASRTTTIRKEICGIRQHTKETLHEYWEHFNKLCATCPHHQINEQLLIQYFYKGLSMMDRSMIDAASGGALMDKTPVAARHLISNMASNTQQFGIRGPNPSRPVNEIGAASNQRLENQLTELTSLVRQLAVSQHHTTKAAKVCGICTSIEHPTDSCPTLQETESDQTESVGVVGGFQYGKQSHSGQVLNKDHMQLRELDLCRMYPMEQLATNSQVHSTQHHPSHHSNREPIPKSTSSSNLPSQTIPNPRGNASAVTLRSGKELAQPTQHQMPRSTEVDPETIVDLQSSPGTAAPLPFPSRAISVRKLDFDEELLKMFRKVEINIPLLDAIKQIPQYVKFLKELCVHKRRKMKGSREFRGVVSALTKNDSTVGISQALPKKCRDPRIFSIPCTIGKCTFAYAMLDLGASINVMPASIYRSLNFGDLEPTGMTIQLANRSIVQPLGVLEDVLVQINELIFPADFYVLDLEGEASRKESTLILGRPFLMTARTKIDIHTGTLSMEFGDTLVQFNIFEAMKHPTEDHSLFGIDMIKELVEEYFQLGSCSEEVGDFAGIAESSSCPKADYDEVQEFPDSEELATIFTAETKLVDRGRVNVETKVNSAQHAKSIANSETELGNEGQVNTKTRVNLAEKPNSKVDTLAEIISGSEDQTQTKVKLNVPPGSDPEAAQEVKADSNPTRTEATGSSRPKQPKAEIMSAHLVSSRDQVGQTDLHPVLEKSPLPPPPMELKPLPSHLKYAYLDSEQQLPVIIASNLHQEQEEKLLEVLRQHKKAIGWKLSDLPGINPSICMHRILMMEDIKPIRQQQRRLNPTILDAVKKQVTKLLAAGIIYPISNSQWVVPKKYGMTVMKNQQDELVPTRIQNSWRVYIDYRRLNEATHKDHFPLPFIDQVLEKLSGKSHYCFLDGFLGYMKIHIALEDQNKTTFTCPFGTFAYTRMPFGLCNASSTFQRCMTSIFSNLLQNCIEVFMEDFTVYADSFEACLSNLSKVLKRCIDTNLILNFEKCHFMVIEGTMFGYLVSNRGIEVDKAKIYVITSLPNPAYVREVRSFLGHAGFNIRFIKNFSKLALPLLKLLQKNVEFNFDQSCIEAFQELKRRLTSAPILQAPNWDLPFELMYDASNSALGAILGQKARVGQPARVIAYASRTMDSAQQNYTTTEKELLAIKPDAKPRLIRWMLFLQEFNLEIRDKKGAENSVVDHLSRIEKESEPMPIQDEFPDEQLLHIKTATPWFADICNYVATSHFPPKVSRAYKDKIRSDAKYYIRDDPYLWRLCSDKVIRRCIPDTEINSVL